MSERAMIDPELTRVLGDAYAALAELWCSPGDHGGEVVRRRAGALTVALGELEGAGAALARFLGQPPITEEQYIDLFELDPRCALYLGSHTFEEPESCANAGTSDRNGYMIELLAIYRHLGLSPNRTELPDYLPLVIEFLALTVRSTDPIRDKLINEYVLPHLPAMRGKLEQLETPYLDLLEALERVLRLDLGARTKEPSHA